MKLEKGGSKMTDKGGELDFTDEQLRIRVHHVGAFGDFGPIERLKIFGDDIEWIGYDAQEELLSGTTAPSKYYALVNKCIGSTNSLGSFKVMRSLGASSLLPSAPSAEKYTWVFYQGRPLVRNGETLIWGEHTRVVKEVPVEINTLDHLVENGDIPQIDFISTDAQGADCDILLGAPKALSSSAVGVVCEVEFAELYEGQPLFCDTQDLLRKHGFRFCDFLSRQDFNVAPYPVALQGKGFFTVAEALFFKKVSELIGDPPTPSGANQSVVRCLKLAAIALVFDQFDYALGILRTLQEKHLLSLDKLAMASRTTNIKYIKLLRDLVRSADEIEANSPPLYYELGRWNVGTDVPKKSSGNNKWKVCLYLIERLFLRAIRIITKGNAPFYYTPISKVLHAYGLVNVAKAHDKRLVMCLLGITYPAKSRFSMYCGRLITLFYL